MLPEQASSTAFSGSIRRVPCQCLRHVTTFFPPVQNNFRMNRLEISSDQFRKLAERVTEISASYLDELDSRPVAPATSGDEVLRLFHAPLPEQGLGEAALDLLPEIVRLSRVQNA